MSNTITTECPHCGEQYTIVVTDSDPGEQNTNQESTGDSTEQEIEAELLTWEETDPKPPYTGRDEEVPVDQRVQARIRIDGEGYRFVFWHTPDHRHYSYVVRGELNDGPKMKNVYRADEDYIFYTDRGIPKNSEKKWTYLDEDECLRRARIAGLPGVEPADKGRTRIRIGEPEQPLVDDGDAAEELMLNLAKGLIVLQTTRY